MAGFQLKNLFGTAGTDLWSSSTSYQVTLRTSLFLGAKNQSPTTLCYFTQQAQSLAGPSGLWAALGPQGGSPQKRFEGQRSFKSKDSSRYGRRYGRGSPRLSWPILPKYSRDILGNWGLHSQKDLILWPDVAPWWP